jgi:hypothetical protein
LMGHLRRIHIFSDGTVDMAKASQLLRAETPAGEPGDARL